MTIHRIFGVVFCFSLLVYACRDSDSTVTDIDGNRYRTTQIGTQVWMAENLRVTRTPEGKPVTSYFPNGDSSEAKLYGRLYDWATAIQIAPKGFQNILAF